LAHDFFRKIVNLQCNFSFEKATSEIGSFMQEKVVYPISIIGAGNIGSYLYKVLSKKYNFIQLVPDRKRNNNYIHLSEGNKVPIKKWNQIKSFPPESIIFIAVKAGRISAIGSKLKKRLDGTQTLVFLQNGINIIKASRHLANYKQSVRALILFGVNQNKEAIASCPKIHLACYDGFKSLNRIASLFESVGFEVLSKSKNVLRTEWKKAILNIYVNGVTAIFNKTIGGILANKKTKEIAETVLKEAVEVAKLDGIKFTQKQVADIHNQAALFSSHSTSMREDIKNGRKTESPWLYGYLLRVAHRNHLPVPMTQAIYESIHHLEQKKRYT
jgi:2-dehydropantoate 2-reductase